MSSDDDLIGNKLVLNDDNLNAIRAYFNNALDTTQQWIDYAQANADDPAVAQEASLVIRRNMEDIRGQIALTTNLLGHAVRLISGQQAAIEEVTDQRDQIALQHDEAVTELNTVRAEMDEQKALARQAGFDEAESMYTLDPEQMNDIIDEEITERDYEFAETIQSLAAQLRASGEAHQADEMENALGLSMEMRAKAEALKAHAEQIVFERGLMAEEGEIDWTEDDETEDDAA
ncbi:MAG: hypothetical protein IT324_19520 [Anaerolineae bacterium]|nr:hypothetical protein [Anaerolineae bacterium]